MQSNILFILHLPPPVHGAAMMGKYIKDSKLINENLTCTYINLSTAKNFTDISKFKFKKIFSLIKLVIKIFKQLKKEKSDFVYITPNAKGGPFYKDFIVVQFLKLLNCRIVAHYHNKGVSSKQDKWFDDFLYKRFFKNLKVILLSDILYQDIKKYVNYKDVYICPNGIPEVTEQFKTNNTDKTQLLYLSNLQKEKGVIEVLDTCCILKAKGYDFNCNIIGSETSEISAELLSNEINKRNLTDRVCYLGKKYGEEKELLYQETDIFVFPTYYHNECFPVVLLEAMQHGCVCISTDEGAIPDIIDNGINGFIVEKKNPTILANKIESLINDKVLMGRMKKASIEKFKNNFTIDKYEQNIYSILKQLINE